MDTYLIREKADELEKKLNEIISKFIEENLVNLSIIYEPVTQITNLGREIVIHAGVKVNIII